MKFFTSFIFASAANSALIEGWYFIIDFYILSFNIDGNDYNISEIGTSHQILTRIRP